MNTQKNDEVKLLILRSMNGCEKTLCLYHLCYNFIGLKKKLQKDKERFNEILSCIEKKNLILCHKKEDLKISNDFFNNYYKNFNYIENFYTFFINNEFMDFNRVENFQINLEKENLNDLIDFSKKLNKSFEIDYSNLLILIKIFNEEEENKLFDKLFFKQNLENIIFGVILLQFIYEPQFYFNCNSLKSFILNSILLLEDKYFIDVNPFKFISEEYFKKLIEKIQNLITFFLIINNSNDDDLIVLFLILNLLNKFRIKLNINNKELFINNYMNKNINLKFLILSYYKKNLENNMNYRHYINYPFLFNTETKVELIAYESQFEMKNQIQNLFQGDNILNLFNLNNIYFEIEVDRNNILEDTLNQLNKKAKGDEMKKNLKIKFRGEPGVDEGGVKKEFFQILTEKLFDSNFGMFIPKNENRFMWFNNFSFECSLNFELVGIILGMAIYNSIVLDLHFPMALYKKLMKEKLCLEDLKEIEPEIFTTMKNILSYEGDVEVMDLTFSIDIENFGYTQTINLIEDGENKKVTNENRSLYVDNYINWYFNESIKNQYKPFENGFYKVISSDLFSMFESDDVFKAICGSINLDFSELKKTSSYQDGYTIEHRIIIEFWEILNSFNDDQKKSFLKFLTGSDRAPIKGLSEIKMIISRASPDSENLPSSHTCFNHLLIPEYINKDKFKEKLLKAIENCEGFGLY